MSATPDVTLLLVDDEEMNRDMLSRRLMKHGYRVVSASNGPAALALLLRQEFHLVLLDVMMPDMSGLEVLSRIRQKHTAEQLPVIMVTARTQSEEVVEALDMGANDYVTKPVDMAVLLARVKTQIGRRQAEHALRESQERFALAIQGANDGLWDWKVESGEVFYSPRWQAIMGYEDMCPPTLDAWYDQIHPDDVERVRAELAHHLQGNTDHFASEHRVRQRSGQHRWVRARGLAVRNEAGRAVRMAGSLTDITDGKVADALTGLPNRVLFVDRIERLMEYGRRMSDFHFAVLFVDLDRFKNVNDSLGHSAGDELLVQASRRLEQTVRLADTVARVGHAAERDHAHARVAGNAVARFGGDEFAVLVSGITHPGDAIRVAERIVEEFSQPFIVAGTEVFTTASVGIALSASGYVTAEDMLRDADIALYRAKAAGRACCEIFDVEMREQVMARLQLETDLRSAIERQELVLQYQPIFSLTDRAVTSLEALVRWNHPQRGMLQPDQFIPIAEDTGLVVPIGYWVLEAVCRQIQEWRSAGAPAAAVPVAINLSSRHLLVPDIVERLHGIVTGAGVDPAQIELELTETTLMTNAEATREIFERLKACGFSLTIDDFGTGYSSLNYLQRFRVDRLKIDRSFLNSATSGGDTEGIIQAIINLAQHLHLEVVAEGIERPYQLEQLTAMRCGFGQGFLFSRPVDTHRVDELLTSPMDKVA